MMDRICFLNKIIILILVSNFNIASAQYYFDSNFIKKYYNNSLWSLYQNYSNHSLNISQKYNKDFTLNTALNPVAESMTDVGFVYSNEKQYLAFNLYSIPYRPSNRKPQPKAVNFVIGSIVDNRVSEFGVNWFTGYYDKKSANFVPDFNDSTPYFNYDKLRTTNVFYNYINFTNKRKFSYGAAYRGNAVQRKSASSFVYYASVNYDEMNSDSAFIPNKIRNSYDKFGQMNRLNNAYLSAGVGYSATLIIGKVFFTNLTLMGAPGLQYQNCSFVNESKNHKSFNLLIRGDIRYSMGLNFKHFYLVSSSSIALKSYNIEKLDIYSVYSMNQLTVGFRIKRKGRIF